MYSYGKTIEMKDLVGKVIKSVVGLDKYSDEVIITTECGMRIAFYHEQDCCESVSLEDFDGDVEDLVGGLITSSEEVSGDEPQDYSYGDYSHRWTFYKIETNKGGLWMRWLGTSNGYYSESVSVVWQNKPKETK
jgi:hypothetical protein